jgi:heme exporter protein B
MQKKMASFWSETRTLIAKEVTLEIRQKYAFNGILLYVISTVFISYMAFRLRNERLSPATWNALMWVILLFAALNAVAKTFMQERSGRMLYYYLLASPESIIVSKMLYNSLLMSGLMLAGYGVYSLMLQNPVQDQGLFIGILLTGALGFASALTLISGIASKAGNNPVLMAILGFPVLLPMLLLLIKASKNAIDGLERSASLDEWLTLMAINAIVWALALLLFPYLWRS